MGMYSFFEDEDIVIRDWKGLVKYVDLFNKVTEGNWINDLTDGMLDKENKTITFSSWDNIKLISYWYDEYLIFLNGIAKYIDGCVHWAYETSDESGFIEFKDKKCIITTGEMNWNKWAPKDGIRLGKDCSPELKKFFVADSL